MKRISYLVLVLILISCSKHELPKLPDYPNTPTIKFKNVEFSTGTVNTLGWPIIKLKLFLEYTDGDSNLGGNKVLNGEYYDEGQYKYDFINT